MKPKKIIKEIHNYNPYGEIFTYSTLFAYMSDENIVNIAGVGSGKSRGSTELLKKLDFNDVIIKSGFLTPKGFYNTIKENQDKLLVFDEADALLHKKQISRMLKSLLTSKKAVWITNKEKSKIEFDGGLILNCNDYSFGTGVLDKVISNQITMSTNEFKDKIKNGRKYAPNSDVWDAIKMRLKVRKDDISSLDKDETNKVYNFVLNLSSVSSYRVIHRVRSIYKNMKTLFGTLNDDVLELSKTLSKSMVPGDLLIKIIDNIDGSIKKKVLAEKIGNAIGKSQRTGYRRIKKLIRNGYLKEVRKKRVKKT